MKDSRGIIKNSIRSDARVLELTEEELREVKSVLLKMLSDFLLFAKKHDIAWSLGGGSVLGAVRHRGFIPWDDDIDLNIPRADYERLRTLFDRELGDRYVLVTPEDTKEHGMLSAMIRKKGTVCRSFNELSRPEEYCGIAMDIFVVENLYNNPVRRFLHGLRSLAAGYAVTAKKTAHDMRWLRAYVPPGSAAGKIFRVKAAFGRLLFPFSLDRVTAHGVRVYSACRDSASEYVSVPSGRKHYFGEIRKRSELLEYREAAFEGLTVNIPKDAEIYLRALYGPDFMKIPEENARESHPVMELRFSAGKEEQLV